MKKHNTIKSSLISLLLATSAITSMTGCSDNNEERENEIEFRVAEYQNGSTGDEKDNRDYKKKNLSHVIQEIVIDREKAHEFMESFKNDFLHKNNLTTEEIYERTIESPEIINEIMDSFKKSPLFIWYNQESKVGRLARDRIYPSEYKTKQQGDFMATYSFFRMILCENLEEETSEFDKDLGKFINPILTEEEQKVIIEDSLLEIINIVPNFTGQENAKEILFNGKQKNPLEFKQNKYGTMTASINKRMLGLFYLEAQNPNFYEDLVDNITKSSIDDFLRRNKSIPTTSTSKNEYHGNKHNY